MKKKNFNLVLGTAQLDQNYSLSKIKLNESDLKKIINLSYKKKNFFIDTALTYKNSEKFLSKLNLKKFKIITKIKNFNKIVIKDLIKSKKKLKINKFYGILFHSERELLSKTRKEYINLVKSLKDNNLTNKVGVSVYTVKSLLKITKKFNLDLIQIPANIMDRRFLDKKILKKLRQKKTEIFVRSVFLKGILLNNKLRYKNSLLTKYKQSFDAYDRWLMKNKITNNKFFCIKFILSNKINNLVIGFDNFKEYKEILNYKNNSFVYPPNFVKNQKDNNRLLRPDLW